MHGSRVKEKCYRDHLYASQNGALCNVLFLLQSNFYLESICYWNLASFLTVSSFFPVACSIYLMELLLGQ